MIKRNPANGTFKWFGYWKIQKNSKRANKPCDLEIQVFVPIGSYKSQELNYLHEFNKVTHHCICSEVCESRHGVHEESERAQPA